MGPALFQMLDLTAPGSTAQDCTSCQPSSSRIWLQTICRELSCLLTVAIRHSINICSLTRAAEAQLEAGTQVAQVWRVAVCCQQQWSDSTVGGQHKPTCALTAFYAHSMHRNTAADTSSKELLQVTCTPRCPSRRWCSYAKSTFPSLVSEYRNFLASNMNFLMSLI